MILNCSEDVSWEVITQHVNKMVLRLQFSGYTQKFRYEVVKAALKAYDDIKSKVSCGDRPLYRPYDWNRQERDELKKVKAVQWYSQVANRRGGFNKRGGQNFFQNSINGGVLINGGSEVEP